jgi:type IV secretory pathway component VirB8
VNAINKLAPWSAKPLSTAAKERKFRELMDLNAERALLGRSAILVGWALGGTGIACMIASAVTCATLFPLKTVEYRLLVADQSRGIIGTPVGLQDAPKVFGEANDRYYLRRYIEAREQYVYELDQQNDHLAKVMSSPDEQARIAEKRLSPDSPARKLGKDGHVQVENFRFHRGPNGRSDTRSYLVQFEETVWHQGNKEPTRPYTASIDFQWHPELPMTPADRDVNAGGMQVIAYSANSDIPDQKRQ